MTAVIGLLRDEKSAALEPPGSVEEQGDRLGIGPVLFDENPR
jgi:hypothetical protein